MNNAKTKLCYLLLFCSAFAYLYFTHRSELTDRVRFGKGDEWSYQILAVNLLHGHGYQDRLLEPFETYRFGPRGRKVNEYYWLNGKRITSDEIFLKSPHYSFWRTPGYPFFLALIYGIFGVHPVIAGVIQMMLLASVTVIITWISVHYWGNPGILIGGAASFLFLGYFCPPPSKILTESLITFALSVWALIFIAWEIRSTPPRIVILGVASGALLLIKGSNVFIPLLFLLYLFIKEKRSLQFVRTVSIFLLGFICVMTPWTVYASAKSGHFLLLSTQSQVALLEGNNEDSLKDGGWHMQGRSGDSSYLHNRLKGDEYSPVRKVFIFLNENKRELPAFFWKKFLRAFPVDRSILLFLIMSLMVSYYLLYLLRHLKKERIPVFPLFYFINILLITLIFLGHPRFTLPFLPFLILAAVHFSFVIVKEIYVRLHASFDSNATVYQITKE